MSKTELIVAGFSYEGMDKDTEGKLRHCAKKLQDLKTALAGDILRIGEYITMAHEQFAKRGTGSFLKWVEFEGGFSKSSAYNYMAAYKVFGELPTVGKIEDTAMYVLAQNETPEKARQEVIKLTEKGTKVTQKLAKQIIKKHAEESGPATPSSASPAKPPKPAPPPPPQLTKEEQIKAELKKARSYAETLVRAIDDVNRVKRNTQMQQQLLKFCGQILEGLQRW